MRNKISCLTLLKHLKLDFTILDLPHHNIIKLKLFLNIDSSQYSVMSHHLNTAKILYTFLLSTN